MALLLTGTLAGGAAPRCAPPAAHSCCAAEASCCCGDAGACTCDAGEGQTPAAPAAPQRAGDELRPELAVAAAAAVAPLAGAAGPGAPLRRCGPLPESPPSAPDFVALRC